MFKSFIYFFILFFCLFSCRIVRKPAKQQTSKLQQEKTSILQLGSLYPKGEYNPSKTKDFDLIHTKLEISFDWEKQYLHGKAILTLKPWFYPQNILELNARGFDVHSVTLVRPQSAGKDTSKWSNSTNTEELKYEYDSLIIKIFLNKTYSRDEKLVVQIEYTAKPNELPEGGSAAIHSDKGLYFINPDGNEPNKPRQIWTQGEPESNSCWFPTNDSPNEKMSQEIYITIDTNFTTLSNGRLINSKINKDGTKTDYWKQDLPHAPYLTMIAIGEFAVIKDHWNDMEVNYYVEPEYARYAKNIFGNTPEMIEFFSNKFGYKYPWAKYSQVVVRDYVSGAMENTTATVLMEEIQVDNRDLLDENWDGIIAHELSHHWFGDLVTCESWANLPLNESFGTYSEYLWAEYKYGTDEADYLLDKELKSYFNEAKRKQVPMIRYYYLDMGDMFDSHSYAKGSRILHMLRKYLGDDAFFESLKVYLHRHEYTDVEIHDLRIAFEDVTGEDLNWFFNQWFFSSGHPDIGVEHQFVVFIDDPQIKSRTYRDKIPSPPNNSEGALILKVWQNQDSAYNPIYRLPLSVDIWVDSIKQRHEIEISKSYQEFKFKVSGKPDLVLFDGEQQLLGTITHHKLISELIFQYYNSDKYLARYESINELTKPAFPGNSEEMKSEKPSPKNSKELGIVNDDIRAMMIKALSDRSWRLRKMAVGVFYEYSGKDLDSIFNIIRNLALSDSASLIRSDAIWVLYSMNKLSDKSPDNSLFDFKDVFIKGMKDSSYSVVAASLRAYTFSNATDIDDKINEFEKSDREDIIGIISEYFAHHGDTSKYKWFSKKLVQLPINSFEETDFDQNIGKIEIDIYNYMFIQYFGQYLLNIDNPETPRSSTIQKAGIKLLEDIARNAISYYDKLAAYQALGYLKKVEDVNQLRNDIKESEPNKHLRFLYDLMK